ncbi:amino acid adenylation domain-containing protein [Bradyrhizobium sp. BR 10261]|uniref:non-ribosomal peptide synthetase n=1 Tax=Bradyrhizobium sp. BR 10261 TaxID=2749992 RepID=UPI001C64801F|nr:non-ribosomal peptide synthetase [Bradyrhizobium sp. BR 10261]MBW7967170.1 non-ribosomal peptide synthetase [Bradyrhizobium sp. BR 10261]
MPAHELSSEGDAGSNGVLLHCDFERVAALVPNTTALDCNGITVSYGELNNRANLLAQRLRLMGIRPDAVVGLFIERSIDMVVGLLGILKAGGAYLPLDPDYPLQRLSYMLDDAEARVVVTHRALSGRLDSITSSAQIVRLDDSHASGATDVRSARRPRDLNLAYVVYTSGSTGAPKGVMVPHCGPVNYLRSLQETFKISRQDRSLTVSTLSFDASVRDIFGALNAGASVHIVPGRYTPDPEALTRIIQSGTVSVLLSSTPSLLRALCMHASPELKSRLRLILVSGEVLDQALISEVSTCFGTQVQIVNQYGPTECTMTTTRYAVGPSSLERTLPIGKPIANTKVQILNDALIPVQSGEVGHIFILGAGLARGYVQRPDLTAERFLPNPFGVGERLYRTGDLGRFRADGELEFLGRTDQQVKIRGNRIELGEVEAVMLSHVAVNRSVVDVREDRLERRLVAYLVLDGGYPAPSSADLREFCRSRLPDYMVPSAFVVLPSLPLTPNGKLDRRALPPPDYHKEQFVPPRTPLEVAVARIWAEVLGIDRVGANDNFFDLGGHSLSAMRIAARLHTDLGIQIELRALFEANCLRDFTREIARTSADPLGISLDPPESRAAFSD